jgi:hypothetical protein
MTAEVMMPRLQDKYKAFIYTMMGACLMVMLFNMLRPYPLFFLVAMFVATVSLYLIALHRVDIMLPLVPIILSLAAYSLLYPTLNANFKMLLENVFTTVMAMLVIIAALLLFPLSYYYRLWLRAFRLAVQAWLNRLLLIHQNQVVTVSLFEEDIKQMLDFSNMLPRYLPCYSILKINLLMHGLKNQSEVSQSVLAKLDKESLALLIENTKLLIQAIEQESTCELIFTQDKNFIQLIQSWNLICMRQ